MPTTIRTIATGERAYARQAENTQLEVDKNTQLEVDAAELRMRAERRLGRLIAAQRETVGLASGPEHGGRKRKIDGSRANPTNARPTLAATGIDKHLADRARKLAAVPAGWKFAKDSSPIGVAAGDRMLTRSITTIARSENIFRGSVSTGAARNAPQAIRIVIERASLRRECSFL